jgi:acyl carrier protein
MDQNTTEATPSVIERRKALVPMVSKIVTRVIGEENPSPEVELFDMGADSLDHVEIVMEVEKEFNVRILDDQAVDLKSINSISDYLVTVHKI